MVKTLKIVGMFAVIILIAAAAHASGPTAQSPVDWTGFDVGVFAGNMWANLEYSEPDYPGSDRDPNFNGFSGGAFLGYNFQLDRIVLGAEADGGYCKLSVGNSKTTANDYSAFEINWNAHVRTRIGFAFDSALLYVAGGLALAEVTIDDTDEGWGKDDATHVGWTVGGGIEYAITRSLRARVEYLYDAYGSKQSKINGDYSYKADVDLTSHTIRVGLSYWF